MNEIERELIAFLSKRLNKPYTRIEQEYMLIKGTYDLQGVWFKTFLDDLHNLHNILYRDDSDEAIIDAMKFYEFSNLLRMVSYSFPVSPLQKYTTMFHKICHDPKQIRHYITILRNKLGKSPGNTRTLADVIETYLQPPFTIVDYGAGLGYLSYQLAQKYPGTKVFLLDIPTLIFEFAEYRFQNKGIDVEVIPVTKQNIYPKLPQHNLCIASEVMEHIREPVHVFKNIDHALTAGGLLSGNFSDHSPEVFHVSPELGRLREALEQYERITPTVYRKPE